MLDKYAVMVNGRWIARRYRFSLIDNRVRLIVFISEICTPGVLSIVRDYILLLFSQQGHVSRKEVAEKSGVAARMDAINKRERPY